MASMEKHFLVSVSDISDPVSLHPDAKCAASYTVAPAGFSSCQTFPRNSTRCSGDEPNEVESEKPSEVLVLDQHPSASLNPQDLAQCAKNICEQVGQVANCNVSLLFKSSVFEMQSCPEYHDNFHYFKFLSILRKKYSDTEVELFVKSLEDIVTKRPLQRIIVTLLVIFWVQVYCMIKDDFVSTDVDVLRKINAIYKYVLLNKNCLHGFNQHFPFNLLALYLGVVFRWFFMNFYKNFRCCRVLYRKTRCIQKLCRMGCVFLCIQAATILFIMGNAWIFMKAILTEADFQDWVQRLFF